MSDEGSTEAVVPARSAGVLRRRLRIALIVVALCAAGVLGWRTGRRPYRGPKACSAFTDADATRAGAPLGTFVERLDDPVEVEETDEDGDPTTRRIGWKCLITFRPPTDTLPVVVTIDFRSAEGHRLAAVDPPRRAGVTEVPALVASLGVPARAWDIAERADGRLDRFECVLALRSTRVLAVVRAPEVGPGCAVGAAFARHVATAIA